VSNDNMMYETLTKNPKSLKNPKVQGEKAITTEDMLT